MPRYKIIITRDTTESTVVDILADDATSAVGKALRQAQREPHAFDWVPDDSTQGDIYFGGDESECEPEEDEPRAGQTLPPEAPATTLSAKIAAPVAPPELPSGVTFNEANLETGMCLWEAMLEIRDRADITARFEDVGTVAMRHAVMTLIPDCEREWEEARAAGAEQEPYDWEHCPRFLERNLSRLGIDAVGG